MKPEQVVRAFEDAARHIDDADYTMSGVHFTVGYLLGGDMAHAATLVLALAEAKFGAGAPGPDRAEAQDGLTRPRGRVAMIEALMDQAEAVAKKFLIANGEAPPAVMICLGGTIPTPGR